MTEGAPPFVHLRVHTEFSLVDGIVRIKEAVEAARDAGMPAVAVTDQSNLFGMVKFYRAALAAGVKPIIGADVWLEDRAAEAGYARLTLLCRDQAGFRALSRLLTRAYREGIRGDLPILQRDWLPAEAGGLLALSGGAEGDVGQALLRGDPDTARHYLAEHRETFGEDGFYLEVHRLGRPGDERHLHAAVALAAAEGAPVVATNDVRFMRAEDFDAHEVRVCIHQGRTLDDPDRPRRYTEQQSFTDAADMAERFADLPEALATSVRIAERCNVDLELDTNYLPEFPVPEEHSAASYLRAQAEAGLGPRLQQRGVGPDEDPEQVRAAYQQRLDHELGVIEHMGFPGYFLIVADFIRWARDNGIPVGPGRGSGAGSLVAYALGITNLDPLRYDLLFERFLNPERVSMPDFDVDFCMERRDEVIEYVAERYGAEKVSQIATHGTMAARAVVRDVGRVYGHPFGYVDRIAKLIPFEAGMTLDKALEEEDLRAEYDNDETVRELLDTARSLEGMSRNVGKHAGGVVIAPSDLTNFSPLYRDPEEREDAEAWKVATHFDKDDVEAVGLVKFDFLGLRTLTIIDWTVQSVNRILKQRGEQPLDIDEVPLDDSATFDLLKRCATTAVFQLESRGMKELIKRLQPDSFEDIIALVALFRPGPLQSGMVEDFVERKHGRSAVAGYPTKELHHPNLVPVLQSTYGVILYQEQVQRIAQVLAGYSLGEADLLRRAMGKKKPEEMAKQRAKFLEGAQANGLSEAHAQGIFELVEKFAGYGFNKCVHGDTRLIEAHTGEQVTVAELFHQRRPFSVHAEGADGRLVPRPVTDVVWNGRKPVFELRTAEGRRIKATAGHRFRVREGWRRVEALAVGEQIAIAQALPVSAGRGWHPVSGERLEGTAAPDIRWDAIAALEPWGTADTYDLTVDTDHNYVAEGIVTHNSHSAAYALLSYQTAWLKRHYPAPFMASVLSSDMDNTDKVVTFLDEARAMGLEVLPPDVNRSDKPFRAVDERTIVYGLGAIKGVGESALDAVLGAREAGDTFTDLFDLCRRVDTGRANRRVLEALCRSGSLDRLVPNRASGMAQIPAALAAAEQVTRDRAAGQTDLFGGLEQGPAAPASDAGEGVQEVPEWPDEERLAGEKETLGLFLTGHPVDRYEAELPYLATDRLERLASGAGVNGGDTNGGRGSRTVTAAGLVIALRVRNTASGGRLATLTLDDRTGRIEAVLFPEAFSRYRDVVVKDALVVVRGSLDYDDFSGGYRIAAEEVLDIAQARERAAGRLVIPVTAERAANGVVPRLREALSGYTGRSPVHVDYRHPRGQGRVVLGQGWTVAPSDELIRNLERVADGPVAVEYPR